MIKRIFILLFLLLITAYLIVAVTVFNTKPADQTCKGMELIINTNALTEGEPGESVMLTETEVTVKLEQYGEYARCTDKLDLSHLDMNILR